VEHPQRIGDYEILGVLGKGGMGTVFKVRREGSDRLEALKVLPGELAREQRFLSRFKREIRVLQELDHPNIARIYDSGKTDDNYHYYTMELVDGLPLDEIMEREGRMSVDDTLNIIRQCCRALDYAHQQKIVHRDIKPGNILVSFDWHVKITDFGIAHAEEATRMTATGSILGTAEYMSPEQAQGKKIDGRSDIYSLGVVFYQMITGRLPFVAETALEVMRQHRFSIPDSPKDYNPEISMRLAGVIMKMMAKEPTQRFDSFTAVLRALELIEKAGTVRADEAEKVDEKRRKAVQTRENIETMISALKWIVLGVVCVVVLAFWYSGRRAPASAEEKYERAVEAIKVGDNRTGRKLLREVLVETAPNEPIHVKARAKLEVLSIVAARDIIQKRQIIFEKEMLKAMESMLAMRYFEKAVTVAGSDRELALAYLDAVALLFGDTEWGGRARELAADVRAAGLWPTSRPVGSKQTSGGKTVSSSAGK